MATHAVPVPISRIKEPPIIGSMREGQRERLAFYRRLAREAGDMTEMHFGPFALLIMSTPELAHEVLVEHAQDFDKGMVLHRAFGPIIGDGLINSEGEPWRQQRKLMA